tara:strand:+ start:12527 stop:13564 length:1038 start_codon:yes stop_codon:yes gene_type:complete
VSLKFPNVRPDRGEIIEPDDLNQNLKQFVDEINGNLTHDNLSDFDLEQSMFKDETFSEVYQSSLEATGDWDVMSSGFIVSKDSAGYTRVDSNDKSMPLVNFIAERDGYIIVDFTASFVWRGSGLLNEEEFEVYHKIGPHFPVSHATIYWGNKSMLPAGGWIGGVGAGTVPDFPGSLGYHPRDKLTVESADGSGPFTTFLKARDFPQGRWLVDGMDRFAVKFRVVSNGNEICESGWVYNGVDRNSVFLTGVIPVRAGRNEIRTEVAGAMLQSIYGTSAGIRAKDSAGDKGQFFPKSLYSSRDVAMPLPKSEAKTFSKGGQDGDVTINLGIDCSVQASNLVVQYRKA